MLAPLVFLPGRLTRLLVVPALLILPIQHGIPAAHAAGSTYYAAPGGSGSTCSQAAPCSLATALGRATSGADTVMLASGTYANTHVTVTAPVTLQGAGAANTVLDGGGSGGSVIAMSLAVSATFRGLTVQHGTGNLVAGFIAGGGILGSGALILVGVTVRDNHIAAGAVTGAGGGIYAPNGGITLTSSTVTGNSVSSNFLAEGGGIEGGSDILTNSIVSGNSVAGGSEFAIGGGIDGDANTLTNSTISGNTATNTSGSAFGGGINGGGNTVIRSDIINNSVSATTSGASGGGISGGGNFLTSSIVSGNTVAGAGANGGGINGGGNTLTNSTISSNTATDIAGGGAFGGGVEGGGNIITNSTISGNTVSAPLSGGFAFGGGVDGGGDLLTNATFSNNRVVDGPGQGGGVYGSGELIANTILVANTANGAPSDCQGGVGLGDDLGGNLADDASCGFSGASGPPASLNNATVALGPLQDNGGPLAGAPGSQVPLLTQALPAGSLAINHGVVGTCLGPLPTPTSAPPIHAGDVDERSLPRHAMTRNACDSGAYDTGGTATNPLTVTGAVNVLFGSGWRLGFAASTDPAFNIGYITFQQGASTLVVRRPITLSCPNQCGGTADDPALGTATVTLGGTVSSGRGQFAPGDTVVVTLTVLTARGTGTTVATYTVSAVAVQVFAPNSTSPLASVSANGPFQGQSAVRFVPLHQTPAP